MIQIFRRRMVLLALLFSAGVAPAKKKKTSAPGIDIRDEISVLSQTDSALATLYELDLKPEQLHLAVDGAEKSESREPAAGFTGKDAAKLKTTLEQLKDEYLHGQNDEKIQALRNQVIELNDTDSAKLPDGVGATAASCVAAHDLFLSLRASQVAAYLASHADQVTDPAERMVSVLTELREENPEEAKSAIDDCAADVALLTAGADVSKSGDISKEVRAWMTKNASQTRSLSDSDFTAKADALEKSARTTLQNVSSMKVLQNWMENTLAAALANPQMADAARELLAAREEAHP